MPATIQTILKPTKARALDTSGNNNHGQIYSGRALEFDGVTDYLNLGEKKTLVDYSAETTQANRAWTVACWINVNDYSSIAAIIGGGYTISSTYFCVHSSGKLGVWDIVGGGTPAWRTGDKVVETGVWYRAVVVFDGDENVTFYLNGVQDGSSGVIDTSSHNADLVFEYIGKRSDGSPRLWDGKLSDLQLWQGAWTADDALYDYNNPEQLALNRGGTLLTNSNLKAWYPMNDGHRGQQSYILDASNTGLGDEKWDSDKQSGNLSGWVAYGSNEIALDGDAIKVTYVNSSGGAYVYLRNISTLDSDLTVGQTYKMTVDAKMDGTAAQITYDRTGSGDLVNFGNLTTEWDTYDIYFTAQNTTDSDLRFNNLGSGEIAYVKNFSLKPVNDKNHATTVFYGDEQISSLWNRNFGGASEWTNRSSSNAWDTYNESASSGATEGTYFTDNYLHLAVTSDASNNKGAYLDGAHWEDSDTMVVGRTYRLSYSIEITAYTSGTLSIGLANTSNTMDTDSDKTYTATKTAATDYFDFVYAGTTDHAKIMINATTSSAFTVYFDNFSLKEVGTATGWTDADQQLDIPQTALQSYNQLAWFPGVDPGTDYDVDCGSGSDIDDIFDGGGTVSAWVYPISDGAGDTGRIIQKASGTGPTAGWYLATSNHSGSECKLRFDTSFSSTNGLWITDNRSLKIGKWNHVVLTWNDDSPDNQPKFYVNGELVDSTEQDTGPAGTYDTDASRDLLIGNEDNGTETFAGCITEVSFWGSVLSADNINELYNDGKALDATTILGSFDTNKWNSSAAISIGAAGDSDTVSGDGSMIVFANSPNATNVYQQVIPDLNSTGNGLYEVTFTVSGHDGGAANGIRVILYGDEDDAGGEFFDAGTTHYSNGTFTEQFPMTSENHTASGSLIYIQKIDTGTGSLNVSNISVKEIFLKGYWRNNGLATWTDLTGNGNHGTVNNLTETMLITAGADGSRDSQGFLMNRQRATNSLNLSDAGGYCDSPTGGFAGTSDFSIECWFKTDELAVVKTVLGKGEEGGGGKRYQLYIDGSNNLQAELDDDTALTTWAGSTNVCDGKWKHAVVTYDRNGNGQIYLNSATEGSATGISGSDGTLDPTAHRDFCVGIKSDTESDGQFNGQIDDVKFYTKKLEAAEVLRNYNAGKRSHR